MTRSAARLRIVVMCFVATGAAGVSLGAGPRITVRETLLGAVPEKSLTKPWATSPDLRRLAYARQHDGQWQLVLDGRVRASFADVLEMKFSPDSQRLAVVARQGEKHVVWTPGNDPKPCDQILAQTLIFSPDSMHLAYAAKRGGKWYVVADGVETPTPKNGRVRRLLYSDNGNRLAAVVEHGGTWSIVIDDAAKEYESLSPESVTFSPDGKRLAAVITRHSPEVGLEQVVVIDGTPQKSHGALRIAPPVFSPDGKRLAYAIKRRMNGTTEWAIVVDDGAGKGFEAENVEGLTFSPDSKRWACVMTREGGRGLEQFVLADTGAQPAMERVLTPPLFSPDGKSLAYAASAAAKGSSTPDAVLVVDGQEQRRDRRIAAMAFTPDGRHLVCAVMRTDGRWVVAAGDSEARCRAFGAGSLMAVDATNLRYLGEASSPADADRQWLRVDVEVGR